MIIVKHLRANNLTKTIIVKLLSAIRRTFQLFVTSNDFTEALIRFTGLLFGYIYFEVYNYKTHVCR